MNHTKQILILTLALLATGVLCDNIDCTTLLTQKDCNANPNTCNWTSDITRNTCTQSIKCADNKDVDSCQKQSDKICKWEGLDNGCWVNNPYCKLNTSNYSCASGCLQGEDIQCNPVLIDTWGCVGKKGNDCNTVDTPYCILKYTCDYNKTAQCQNQVQTATADKDCTGPCSLGSFTCTDSCPNNKNATDCKNATGCKWNSDANTCNTELGTCPTNPKKVSDCTKVGCSVVGDTLDCKAPANNDYQKYCSANKYCTDNAFCTKTTDDNTCISDVNFCTQPKNCGDPQPYKQCLIQVFKTCSNVKTPAYCAAFGAQKDCKDTCQWSNGKTCNNVTNNSACSALYKTEDQCKTLADSGCVFQPGGVCTSKTADYAYSTKLATSFFSIFIIISTYLIAFY